MRLEMKRCLQTELIIRKAETFVGCILSMPEKDANYPAKVYRKIHTGLNQIVIIRPRGHNPVDGRSVICVFVASAERDEVTLQETLSPVERDACRNIILPRQQRGISVVPVPFNTQ